MYNFIPPPLSKVLWSWLREWQNTKKMTDEDLAAAMKLNIRTLKSYDVSAHTLTLEKLDNLVSTLGAEPVLYVFNKYVEYVKYLKNRSTEIDLLGPYFPQLYHLDY
ncbi:hypothetical protein SAMN02910353_02505 [Ruminococcus sp. YRD2003]|uniref:hypothetical protein n=1 Tax=Ruminococcus sp. YRD2003 TaxID=1452313 RepID=UPI0008C6639E|nr:hypothetical protein SAMN02910353_02505 [Ruminococcus flavefaciens]